MSYPEPRRLKPIAIAIIIGVYLLLLVCLLVTFYFWPTVTPPDKVVVPVVVAPAEPQEEPQAAQEDPEAPQGNLSTPDAPTLAPILTVLPVPPPSVIKIPVEVIVKPGKPAKPGRHIPCYRRGWFR